LRAAENSKDRETKYLNEKVKLLPSAIESEDSSKSGDRFLSIVLGRLFPLTLSAQLAAGNKAIAVTQLKINL
jgi:hypothetical protein